MCVLSVVLLSFVLYVFFLANFIVIFGKVAGMWALMMFVVAGSSYGFTCICVASSCVDMCVGMFVSDVCLAMVRCLFCCVGLLCCMASRCFLKSWCGMYVLCVVWCVLIFACLVVFVYGFVFGCLVCLSVLLCLRRMRLMFVVSRGMWR